MRKNNLKLKLHEDRKESESEYILSKEALKDFKKEPHR